MAIMNTRLMSSMQTTEADFKEIDKKLETLNKAAGTK